jgi:hypothetical protein
MHDDVGEDGLGTLVADGYEFVDSVRENSLGVRAITVVLAIDRERIVDLLSFNVGGEAMRD